MSDSHPSGHLSRREIIFTSVGAAVAGAAIFIGLINDWISPITLLVPLGFILSYILAVCLHELGHAWAATSAGGTVLFIQIGQRYREWEPWRFKFFGYPWVINSAPFSGLVQASFYSERYFRMRNCWMIAWGPLVNLILLGIGFYFLSAFDPIDLPRSLGISWCLANGLILLYSVPPHLTNNRTKAQPNDGLLFLKTLRYSDQEIRQYVQWANEARRLGENSSLAQTLSTSELTALHEKEPSDHVFLWHLINKFQHADDPRCLDYLIKLVELPGMSEIQLAPIIDSILTWQLHIGPSSRPEIVDRLSSQLLASENTISTRGTRGSVLIDLGRIEEGKAMLMEVLSKTNSRIDKSYSNIFLALAAKSEGQLDRAADHALAARQIDPACPALCRISDLLVPTATTGDKDPSTSSG